MMFGGHNKKWGGKIEENIINNCNIDANGRMFKKGYTCNTDNKPYGNKCFDGNSNGYININFNFNIYNKYVFIYDNKESDIHGDDDADLYKYFNNDTNSDRIT